MPAFSPHRTRCRASAADNPRAVWYISLRKSKYTESISGKKEQTGHKKIRTCRACDHSAKSHVFVRPAAGDAGVIAIAVVGILALASAVLVIRKKR